jgi:hypothetical protein
LSADNRVFRGGRCLCDATIEMPNDLQAARKPCRINLTTSVDDIVAELQHVAEINIAEI